MSVTSNTVVADVSYIFSELARINSLLKEAGMHALREEDRWYDIPAPGGGQYLIGRAAGERLQDIASHAAKSANVSKRVTAETMKRLLKDALCKWFLVEKKPINNEHCAKLIGYVGKAARNKCQNKTHVFPCHLTITKEPHEFEIGPVRFRNRSETRKLLLTGIKKHKFSKENMRRKYERELMARAIVYYRKFLWSAEVEVFDCEEAVSKEIGLRCVTSALDCLSLLFGAQHTDDMTVGGLAFSRDERAEITISDTDGLQVSLSFRRPGQVGFSDDWASCFDRPDFKHALSRFSLALATAVDPDITRPVSQRFLEAAQWFGEAARDASPSTQVVKYAIALERMVMTDERDDITRLVSERAAALCFDGVHKASLVEWQEKVRTIYRLRSKLVHGSLSPNTREVIQGVYLAEEVAREALIATVCRIDEAALTAKDVSTKRLADWFARVVEWADHRVEVETMI